MNDGLKIAWTRAWRTFARVMAAPLAAAAAVNWLGGEAGLGATRLTLSVIVAAIAGVSAFALAYAPFAPTSPAGKAFAEFLQAFGAGIAVVGIADLTGAALIGLGHQIGAIAISAGFAAVISLVTNSSEKAVGAVVPKVNPSPA